MGLNGDGTSSELSSFVESGFKSRLFFLYGWTGTGWYIVNMSGTRTRSPRGGKELSHGLEI